MGILNLQSLITALDGNGDTSFLPKLLLSNILVLIVASPSYLHVTFDFQMIGEEIIFQLCAIHVGKFSFGCHDQGINVFWLLLMFQGLDGVEKSQVQNIEVWTIWWLIWQLHMNAVMLQSLHYGIICSSCVRLGIFLLNNATLISNGPLLFNCQDHLIKKPLCRIHPVDAGNAFFFIVPAGRFLLLLFTGSLKMKGQMPILPSKLILAWLSRIVQATEHMNINFVVWHLLLHARCGGISPGMR